LIKFIKMPNNNLENRIREYVKKNPKAGSYGAIKAQVDYMLKTVPMYMAYGLSKKAAIGAAVQTLQEIGTKESVVGEYNMTNITVPDGTPNSTRKYVRESVKGEDGIWRDVWKWRSFANYTNRNESIEKHLALQNRNFGVNWRKHNRHTAFDLMTNGYQQWATDQGYNASLNRLYDRFTEIGLEKEIIEREKQGTLPRDESFNYAPEKTYDKILEENFEESQKRIRERAKYKNNYYTVIKQHEGEGPDIDIDQEQTVVHSYNPIGLDAKLFKQNSNKVSPSSTQLAKPEPKNSQQSKTTTGASIENSPLEPVKANQTFNFNKFNVDSINNRVKLELPTDTTKTAEEYEFWRPLKTELKQSKPVVEAKQPVSDPIVDELLTDKSPIVKKPEVKTLAVNTPTVEPDLPVVDDTEESVTSPDDDYTPTQQNTSKSSIVQQPYGITGGGSRRGRRQKKT
jgi:hypothetical protein